MFNYKQEKWVQCNTNSELQKKKKSSFFLNSPLQPNAKTNELALVISRHFSLSPTNALIQCTISSGTVIFYRSALLNPTIFCRNQYTLKDLWKYPCK